MIIQRLLRQTQEYLRKARDPFSSAEKVIFRFSNERDLSVWRVFSDKELGGTTTASLILSSDTPSTASFSGYFSREIGENAFSKLKRSGFAGIESKSDGSPPLDLDDYDGLTLRVKGDGRKYIANIKTENWLVGDQTYDIWQAFLFARENQWQDVEIPFSRFLLTWKGRLVETKTEMNPARITSIGISLAGGEELQPEGEFRLDIDYIAARRDGQEFKSES